MSSFVPVTVNLHILRECNYACTHCYAGFPTVSSRLGRADCLRLIHRLAAVPWIFGQYRVTKLTFAGGEPTLHPDLPDLVRAAREAGFTTCVVTNGFRLAADLDLGARLAPWLDWLAVSVDGPTEELNRAHGRGRGDAISRVRAAVDQMRAARPALRLKLNTVVTALNWQTSMVDLVHDLGPERWKVFQVTLLAGENDAAYPELAITAEQFGAFVVRQRAGLRQDVTLVPEREGQVQGSYLMVQPDGRLFCNVQGRLVQGPSLLAASLDEAAREVGWDASAFVGRGGAYDWEAA